MEFLSFCIDKKVQMVCRLALMEVKILSRFAKTRQIVTYSRNMENKFAKSFAHKNRKE
jgi:hypothetical protein